MIVFPILLGFRQTATGAHCARPGKILAMSNPNVSRLPRHRRPCITVECSGANLVSIVRRYGGCPNGIAYAILCGRVETRLNSIGHDLKRIAVVRGQGNKRATAKSVYGGIFRSDSAPATKKLPMQYVSLAPCP